MFDVRLPVEQKGDNLVPTLKKQDGRKSQQGPIFRTFFAGKIPGKIPRKIFPPKMLGKNGIFRGKRFEKSFFQEILRNFPQKVIFRGKNV
jgi:hypothetical protein